MLMDVDNFKLVNDTLGHAAGDELLVAISPRLHEAMRAGDTVARLGGDEFAFVLEGVAGERDAVAVAERIIAAFDEPFPTSHGDERISASLGIVIAEPDADADTLLRNADAAMYAAKATPKGGYELYDDERRLRMVREVEITNALDRRACARPPRGALPADRVAHRRSCPRRGGARPLARPGRRLDLAERVHPDSPGERAHRLGGGSSCWSGLGVR